METSICLNDFIPDLPWTIILRNHTRATIVAKRPKIDPPDDSLGRVWFIEIGVKD